jgi:hypothetical protein
MEKRNIVKFLNGKKRGVYALIADVYSGVTTSMAISLALEEIRRDLEKESEEKVYLNYNSLARAVARSKKKTKGKAKVELQKRDFKDTNELKDNETAPGKFKID